MKKGLALLLFGLLWTLSADAQVQFKVELLSDNITYRVSLLPSVTWTDPNNITSTAQVTLKVPTGGMGVANVNSLIPGTFWSNNSRYNSPAEAPDFDYISFGLTSLGTSAITYESGVETHLFTFTNDGLCTGAAEITLNNDPFFPPNLQNANVGCQITTFGGGTGVNNFAGAFGAGSANCLSTAGCLVEYHIAQLGDGSYSVSMVADTAWNLPLNITDSMLTTLVVPTGTFSPGNLMGTQPGANFIVTDSFIAPPESPNFDYFVFELENNGTAVIHYQRNLVIPLFTFENSGNCEGDSLFLMDAVNDPFAMPNAQMATVGHFVKTVGSNGLIDACANHLKAAMSPKITNVVVSNLTNCESDNGSILVETSSFDAIQYSIDMGMTWQTAQNFTLLEEGEYWVTIRYDGGTCETFYDQNPVIVSAPTPPVFNGAIGNNPSGCGNENGSISLSASSAISPEYSIDNGQTWSQSNNFTGLGVGTYITRIRNGNMTCEVPGDTLTLEFIGTTSPVLDSVVSNNLTSCTAANGGITFFSSDTLDLEYSIDNGENWSPNPHFIDLAEGAYNLIVRNDSTDCPTVYNQNPVIIGNDENCNDCLVEYELELLADGRYQVSLIPDTTWNFPFNITSTAQVTIIVGTGSFQVNELTNLIPNVTFNDNSRQNAPLENPDFDYISFGLESLGTTNIPYQTGEKVPLFTFRNSGYCSGGEVSLMERDDPFKFPNSQSVNVGQQLSTAGSGQDGLVCVKFPGFTYCIPRVEANDDIFNVYINSTVIGNVIENDTNYLNNGLNAHYINGSTTDHGTVNLQQDGTITYTPDQGFAGIDTMMYQVCGDTFPTTCSIGLITFVVSSGNALIANDDSLTTFVNTPVSGVAQLNDVNPANNNLHYTLSVPPTNGTVSINPDGTFLYTPNIGFFGFDFFIYKVCDDGFPTVCDFAQVKITVTGSNQLVAIDDDFLGMLNMDISNTVLTNDFNPNGGILTTTLLTGSNVAFGSLVFNPDGTFIYTPNNGFVGNDGFDYVVCNSNVAMECDTGHVNLTIVSELMANDDFYNLNVNTSANGNVIDNDVYAASVNLTATIFNNVQHGNLVLNANGTFTYTPTIGFVGLDMFDYILCDNGNPQTCDTATVQLLVQSDIQAVNDNFMVEMNANFTGDVLPNDTFPNGVVVATSLSVNVSHGMLILNTDGTFMYMPNSGFVGVDSFQYNLCDNGMPQTCDLATVYLNVFSGLMAIDDNFTATSNTPFENTVLPNDIIPNGVSTTTTHVVNPQHGTLIIQGNGDFTYIPDNGFSGIDSFYYRLCDNVFPFPCDTALVTLNVLPQLIAENDNYAINFNGNLSESVVTNDTWDVNIPIIVTVTSNVSNGTLVMNPNGDFNYFPNNNYLGVDEFTYQICYDTTPTTCETATVTLSIQALVVAVDDEIHGVPNAPTTGNVTNNDFPNNGNTTVSLLPNSGTNNGILILNPDGTFTYNPNPNFTGTDVFQYVFCNNGTPPLCDTATVTLIIENPIVAVDDEIQTPENETVTGNVVTNDIVPVGTNITVTLVPNSGPNNGTLTLNPDGTFTYEPNPDFTGTDVFEYEICDDNTPQNCDTATVQISVGIIIIVDQLDAIDDEYNTPVNTPISDNVTVNDTFPNGANITVTLIPNSGTNNGSLILNPDGTFTYSPNLNFTGADVFNYIICDNNTPQNCDIATVIINVGTFVDAVDDLVETPISTPVSGNVIDNDNFPIGTTVTVTLVPNSGPSNGDLLLNPDGEFTYNPMPSFEGTDVFQYEICDTNIPQNCDIATVEIVVGNPAPPIEAVDDEYETPFNTPISDNITVNDTFPNGTNITVTLIPNSGPQNGTLILNPDGTFTYTPNNGFNGTDVFEYVICDDNLPQNCDEATVTINVGAYIDAIDDNYQTSVGTPVSGNVADNDMFPNGTIVTVALVPNSGLDHGTLTLNPDGSFIYNPDPNYDGFDVFEYQICDNNTPQNCDIATVVIMIGNPPNPIFAINDDYVIPVNVSISANVILNDIVLNGADVTAALIPNTGPSNGGVILNNDGTFTYTPNLDFIGIDTFNYVICDDNSPSNCDIATVTITIVADPNAITAVNDVIETPVDMPVSGNVLDNDLFPNGSNPTVTLVLNSGPNNGVLTLNPDGTFTYEPNPGFTGTDVFEYEVCDDNTPPNCDTATVEITVTNNPVMAVDDEVITTPGTPVSGNVLDNDLFPNGSNPTVTLVPNSGPNNGVLTLNPDGTFTYVPNSGFEGTDSFTYQVCDDATPPNCDIATVEISVMNPPTLNAIDDFNQTTVNTPVSGNVIVNDGNPNNSDLTVNITPISNPINGSVVLNANGNYTYTPNTGYVGNDNFQYQICDNEIPQNCDIATVFIIINNNGGNGSNLQTPEIVCPDEVCGNSMMTFQMSQFYSGTTIEFEWINATGTIISNTPTLDIAPNNPNAIQPFRVRVKVDGEYTNYSTACFVEQASIPALSVTNSGPMACQGSEVQLLATPMANLAYEWRELGNPTVLSTLPNPMMNVDGDAIYELTVTRVDCPFATAVYATSIQAVDAPDFDPSADYNMGADCTPEPLALTANITGSNLTYVWESNNGFYSTQANPTLLNTSSDDNGMYQLTVTNEFGCSTTKTLGVNNILDFIPEPIITYSGPVCMGEEVELLTQYYAGFDVDYVWMKNGQIMPSNSSNQLIVQPFSPTDTGMYRVMVMVDNCIHQSDEFAIEILETPALAPNFSLTQPCEGGELTLNSNTIAGAQNANYYWTGPNGFTSNAQNPIIPNTTTAHNGSYVLTMSGENGCQKSESFDVEFITAIPEQPAAFANGPICEEGNVILTIQNLPTGSTIDYEWRNGNGLLIGTTESVTLSATDPMMVSPFSVKVTADGCESDLSNPVTVTVENPATPQLDINSDFLCEGESLTLNASLYNGQNTSYQWYFDNGASIVPLSITSTATLFVNDVNASNSGLYFVVAQVNGCATDTSNIQQVNIFSEATPPTATNSSEANPACFGEDVQLEVPLITGATYQWYGPAGFSSTVINPVLENATAAQSGEYFAVINFNGCNITSSPTMVQVQNAIQSPFLLVNDGQNQACMGGDLTLQITNPIAGATYEFYNTQTGERLDSTSNSSITINDITAAQAGQYYATSVVNGCPSPQSNSTTITVVNAPNNVAEAGANQTLCSDFETLNLNAIAPGSGTGQWTAVNSGTVLNPTQANTQVTNLEEGTNLFIWTLSTEACGDYSMDSVFVFTDAIDAMDDNFGTFVNDTMPPVDLIANDLVGNPDNYTFTIVTIPTLGELIDLGNGVISYMPFPGAFGVDQFTYMICSNTCDEICDMATVRITLVGNDDEDYFVPNTITPNGDGINDAFVVPATIQFPGSEVAIFNRLGDEIYFTKDYQNDWEGTYNGKPLPVGTYFYCVRLTDADKTVLRGYVVIKR